MAKRVIKAKYRETRVVNYRHDNNDVKTLLTCTFFDCDEYRMNYNGQIDTSRCKHTVGIQYKHSVQLIRLRTANTRLSKL